MAGCPRGVVKSSLILILKDSIYLKVIHVTSFSIWICFKMRCPFWFQNSYFKGKNGYLSLRHSHMFTFFQCLKPSWPTFFLNIYIYILRPVYFSFHKVLL